MFITSFLQSHHRKSTGAAANLGIATLPQQAAEKHDTMRLNMRLGVLVGLMAISRPWQAAQAAASTVALQPFSQ
jgi:hypothetical protein